MQINQKKQLTTLEKVERIKLLLTERAQGLSPDKTIYSTLRSELIKITELKGKLPEMIRNHRTLDEFWRFIKNKFEGSGCHSLRKEYIKEEFDNLLTELEMEPTNPTQKTTTETLKHLNSEEVQNLLINAIDRSEKDPNGAVTAAKSLLESTCKLLLDDMKEEYDSSDDIPSLFKKISTQLNLHPTQHADKSLKKILSGCALIVQGIAETRNKISDAHGQGRNPMNAEPRHAKLTVSTAGAISAFLVETYQNTTNRKN